MWLYAGAQARLRFLNDIADVQRKAQPRALEVNCNGRAVHLLKPSPTQNSAPVPAPLAKAVAHGAAPKLFAVLPAAAAGSAGNGTKQQQQQQQQRLLLESVLQSEGPRVGALACISQGLNAVFSFAVTVERDSSSSSAADSSISSHPNAAASTADTVATTATTTATAAGAEGRIHGCVASLPAGSGPARQARFKCEQRFVSRVKQLKHCSVTRIVRPAAVAHSSSNINSSSSSSSTTALLGVGASLNSSSNSTSNNSSSSDQEERSRLNATLLDLLSRHVDHALPAYCLPAAMAVVVNSKQHKQRLKGDSPEADVVAPRGSLRPTLHHFTVVASQRKAVHRSQQSQSPQSSPKQRRTSPKSSSPYFAKEAGSVRHAATATAAAASSEHSSSGSAQQQGPVVLHGACLTTWRQLPAVTTTTSTAVTTAAGAANSNDVNSAVASNASSASDAATTANKPSSTSSTVTYVPECKCVLSTLPLYDTLRGLLLQQPQQQPTTAATSSSDNSKPPLSPSANNIRSLTLVAPVPPPAPQQWPFWGAGPIPTLDFPLQPLFHALSFDTVLAALKVLMLEGSLVISGSSASGRVLACEALKALLFPLRTSCHLYAPLLPASEVYSFWRAKLRDGSRGAGSSSRSRSSSRSTSPHSSRRVSGGAAAAATGSSDRISSSDLNSSSSSRRPFFVSLDSRLVHAAATAAATAGAGAHSAAGDDAHSADADSCAVWGLALKEPCLAAVTTANSTVRTAEGSPLGGSGPGELALECVRRMLRQAVHIDLDNDEITLPPPAAAAAAGVSTTTAAAAAAATAAVVDVALAVQAGVPQGPVQQLRERVQQALHPELTTFDHVLPPQSRGSSSSSSGSSSSSLASTVKTVTELLSAATTAATTTATTAAAADVIPMHATSQTDVALRDAFLNFQAALLGRAKEFVTLEVQQSLLRFDSQAFVEAVCGYSAAAAAVSRSATPTAALQQQQQQYFSGAAAQQSAAAAAAVATAATVEFYGELFRTRSFAALLSDDVLSDVDCAALSAQLEARRLELTVVLDQDSSTTGAAKGSSDSAPAATAATGTADAATVSSGTAATAQQTAALRVDTSDSAGEQLAQ
jgi:DENN (AEX-3) domain